MSQRKKDTPARACGNEPMPTLFSFPAEAGPGSPDECFTPLVTGGAGLLVERIISQGHATPEGQWYDQERDEWVLVLEGSAVIGFEDGKTCSLAAGQSLFLPKKLKHRVLQTSSPCIWLAVHADNLTPHA